jgi:hypothetical protein
MVLIERSQSLTTLELVMSFWALGYMLDEVFTLVLLTDFLGGWLFQCRNYTVHFKSLEFV